MSSEDTISGLPLDVSARIPQEIVDRIIAHLHDQPRALKNCRLVSSNWNAASSPHLFYKVEFNSAWTPDGYLDARNHNDIDREYSESLRPPIDFSAITPYIRDFTIYRRPTDKSRIDDLLEAVHANQQSLPVLDVLSSLPNLQSLTIINSACIKHGDLFIAALKKASKNLTSLKLDDLALVSFYGLVQIAEACPALRSLVVETMWWFQTPYGDGAAATLPASLREVTLAGTILPMHLHFWIDWLNEHAVACAPPQLASVVFNCAGTVARRPEMRQFLEIYGASLREVYISSSSLVTPDLDDFVDKCKFSAMKSYHNRHL